MSIRICLVYINILYFLEYINSIFNKLWDFLEESSEFIKDYQERESKKKGSPAWKNLSNRLLERIFKIDLMIRRAKMDYLEATKMARDGTKMRRKCWLKGESQAWRCDKVYMWWDQKHKVMLAGGSYPPMDGMRDGQGQEKYLDTKGYVYITESDDIEAKDWEKADVC